MQKHTFLALLIAFVAVLAPVNGSNCTSFTTQDTIPWRMINWQFGIEDSSNGSAVKNHPK
jgi:hypothetical protein